MFPFLLLICALNVISVDSARILGIFVVPSISHQVVFRALTTELAKRGHELVILTPDPAFKDQPRENVTEIDVSFGYKRLGELMTEYMPRMKRGVILSPELMLETDGQINMVKLIVDMVEYPEFKKITTDKTQHFDLILAEAYLEYHLIYGKIFNAPVITITSFHGFPDIYDTIGASQHPVLFPSIFSDVFDVNSVLQKFKLAKFQWDYFNSLAYIDVIQNQFLRQIHGPDAPTVKELRSNIDMVFINSNPLFCDNRPLPPNAVYIGPLHLQPVKDLPKDLKQFLDNSKTGVIYVSLGTNVRAENMDEDMLTAFIESFREMPYDVLWKFKSELKDLPKNVRTYKWFPQRELLVHPKIKLFVTQGGLQSTDEAIDAGVPMVGVPMLADQYYNVNKHVKLGIGLKVDAITLDKDSLLNAMKTVLNDASFKENIKRVKKVMNDNPQSPLERAVWWTEYVIRNGGAKHLRSPSANISWSEYLMVDLILAVISLIVVTSSLVYLAVRFLIAKFTQSKKAKIS